MWAARRVVSRPMRSLLPWPRVGFVASGPILRSTRPFSYNALGPARDFEEEAAIAMIGDDAAHLTDKMRTESDELIELLFQEVLKPPDVDIYKKSEERGQLANLPHDPDEFFQARPRTPQNYCMLLRVHAAKGLVDEGVQAYHEAVQRGLLEPSVFTETALISLYGAKSKKELATVSFAPARFKPSVEAALAVFADMQQKGIKPSLQTYGALVGTLSSLEHVEQAFKVMEIMRMDGHPPNTIVYTSLILGCVRTGQAERAFETFMQMRIEGQEADLLTFNLMIKVAGLDQNAERALDIMNEIKMFDLTADVQIYASAIAVLADRPDFYEKAFELYDNAMALGYQPTTPLLNSLLKVCHKMGDFETSKLLMAQFNTYNLKPDEWTFMSHILAISKKMRQDQYVCYEAGKTLNRNSRITEAEETFDALLVAGIQPSRRALNAMLMVHTRALHHQQAEEFRRIVYPRYGHSYDYHTYFQLIHMYYYLKRLNDAMGVYQEMTLAGIPADYDMYMLLLRLAKYRKATFVGVKVLKEMCDAGIVADEDVAYPFQEIVEGLPDYKPPPALVAHLKPKPEDIEESRHEKMRQQAKEQRQLMLQTEPTSPLERYRSHLQNHYNKEKFHPANPDFEKTYADRDSFDNEKMPEQPKHQRSSYRLGTTHETTALPKGDAILERLFNASEATYIAEGRNLRQPEVTKLPADRIKVR